MPLTMKGETTRVRNSVQRAGLAGSKLCTAQHCKTPAMAGDQFCARCWNWLPDRIRYWLIKGDTQAAESGNRELLTRALREARRYLAAKPARRPGEARSA
jgi:hypothetical protein